MRTIVVAILLVACGEPAPTPAPPAVVHVARDAGPTADAPVCVAERADAGVPDASSMTYLPALAHHPLPLAAPPTVLTSPHAHPIQVLAVSDDGNAVVSAEIGGGVRLWPSLDGKREPIVVTMHTPVALALALDDTDFAIAALDASGGLELARLRATGEQLAAPLAIASDRPFVSVVATAAGFLALRDDQELELYSLAGVRLGSLVPEPGERIEAVVSRRGRALAVIAAGPIVHARWLELGGPPHWGEPTPALAIGPEHVALSPDHLHLAATTRNGKALVIVELATGHISARPVADGETAESGPPVPLGFTTDGTLAVLVGSRLSWWHQGDLYSSVGDMLAAAAVGDHHAVVNEGSSLGIAIPDHLRILGYQFAPPSPKLLLAHGGMMITNGSQLIETDARFRERRERVLPRFVDGRVLRNLVPLDQHHAIGLTDGAPPTLQLVDLEHPQHPLGIQVESLSDPLYEPSTRLVGHTESDHVSLWRYDPTTGTLGTPAVIKTESNSTLFLLESAGHGPVAAIMQPDGARTKVVEINEVHADGTWVAGRTREHDMSEEASMRIDADLTPLGLSRRLTTHRSPDGTMLVELAHGRLTLRDAAKQVRWVVPAAAISEVHWTADNQLVVLGGGAARVELTTGALVEPQCGWAFGSWEDELTELPGPLLCEAARE